MTTQKRPHDAVDPDYLDPGELEAKRQRALEQDAKHAVRKKIQQILRHEFEKEIGDKERELQLVDQRLNEARLMMDRLRACVVANYYGMASQSSAASSQLSSGNAPPPSIHPAVKKLIGKRPAHSPTSSQLLDERERSRVVPEESEGSLTQLKSLLHANAEPGAATTREGTRSAALSTSPPESRSSSPWPVAPPAPPTDSLDDRRSRFKLKKKVIVGNVSKYIPVDERESNDMSSHKWMVYVRGPKSCPNISHFVRRVWFFLHHSYKPNDLVEVSSPPFHLTRRGWGEFPVRVQLHFVDPRNKNLDIIHHLKLDKTYTGLQSLGAETMVEVELDKDFFEPHGTNNSSSNNSSNNNSSNNNSSNSNLTNSHSMRTSVDDRLLPVDESSPLLCSLSSPLPDNPVASSSSATNHAQVPTHPTNRAQVPTSSDDCVPTTETSVSSACVRSACVSSVACGGEREPGLANEEGGTLWGTVCPESGGGGGAGGGREDHNVTICHDVNAQEEEADVDVCEVVPNSARRAGQRPSSDAPPHPAPAPLHTQESVPSPPPPQCGLDNENLPLEFASAEVTLPGLSLLAWRSQSSALPRSASQSAPSAPPSAPLSLTSCSSDKVKEAGRAQTSQVGVSAAGGCVATLTPARCGEGSRALSQHTGQTSWVGGQGAAPRSTCVSSLSVMSVRATTSSSSSSSSLSSSSSSSVSLLSPPSLSSVTTPPNSRSQAPTPQPAAKTQRFPSPHTPTFPSPHPPEPPPSSNGLPSTKAPSVVPPKDTGLRVLYVPQHTVPSKKVAGTSSSLPQLSAPGRAKVVPGRQVSLLTGRVISPVAPRGDSGLTSAAPRASSGQTAAHRAARGRHTTQALNNVLGTIQHGGRQLLLVANTAAHTQRVNQTPTSLHPHTPPHLADSLPNSSSVPALRSQASTPLATVSTKPGTVTILQSFPQSVSQAAPIPPRSPSVALADSPRVVAVQQTSLVHARLTESAAAQSLLSNPASLAVSPSFEKMSAVGVTKHGKGVRAVPGVAINRSLRTDEERRLGQYEILNAWKNNPEKFSRVPSKSRKVCRSTDVIDGDVDHLPSLHLPDYLDVQSLTRAAVKLHPLLRPGVNRLTHPYCAESPDQWSSWPVGKQRAAEWHRACFTLRYLRECLGGRPHYQGEPLLSTRQLVVWCRRHGFSPCLTQATRGDTEATRGDTEEGVEGVVEGRVSQLLPPTLALSSQLLPPTFTLSSTLEKELRVTDRRTNDSQGGGDDQEIVDITEFTVETGLTARRGAAGGEHGQVTGSCESLSHGARFVTDLLRKRGLKLGPVELEAGLVTLTSADMIYRVAVEFAADLLREAAGVSATRFSRVLSVEDVHSALSSLPTAAFCRSSYLGKEADSDGISR